MKRETHHLGVVRGFIHYGEELWNVSRQVTSNSNRVRLRLVLIPRTMGQRRIIDAVRQRWRCLRRDEQEKHDEETDQADPRGVRWVLAPSSCC